MVGARLIKSAAWLAVTLVTLTHGTRAEDLHTDWWDTTKDEAWGVQIKFRLSWDVNDRMAAPRRLQIYITVCNVAATPFPPTGNLTDEEIAKLPSPGSIDDKLVETVQSGYKSSIVAHLQRNLLSNPHHYWIKDIEIYGIPSTL